MMELISKALKFSTAAHAAVGQKRKYTGEDYIVHPIAVSEIVAAFGGSKEMVAAALLHDTLEDTNGGCEAYVSSHEYVSHGTKVCESWETPVELYNDKGVWKAMKITDNGVDEDGYAGYMKSEIIQLTETWTCDNANNRKDYKAEYLMEDGDSCVGQEELKAWFENQEVA